MSDLPHEEQLTPEKGKSDPPIKPKSSKSVAVYLVILFAAAFVLLLMAYFMQQRSNNEVIGNLQDSVNQFQTLDELRDENQQLHSELEELEKQLEELLTQQAASQEKLEQLKHSYELLEGGYNTAMEESSMLLALYKAEILTAEGNYTNAAMSLVTIQNIADIVQGYDAKTQHYNPDAMLLQPRFDTLVDTLREQGVLTRDENGTLSLVGDVLEIVQ